VQVNQHESWIAKSGPDFYLFQNLFGAFYGMRVESAFLKADFFGKLHSLTMC